MGRSIGLDPRLQQDHRPPVALLLAPEHLLDTPHQLLVDDHRRIHPDHVTPCGPAFSTHERPPPL